MFKFVYPAIALTALVATAPAVQAEELVEWKTVGEWQVVIDKTTGNGCMMQKVYENGFLLQFGLLPQREEAYFAAYREDWTDIEYGKKVEMEFAFDDNAYEGPVTGYVAKPWHGGYAEVNNPEMMYDFAKKYNLKVTGHQGREFELSLDGTLKGVEELIACQKAQGS